MNFRRKVALIIETSNSYSRDVLHGVREWMRRNESWAIRLSEHGRGGGLPAWLRGWRGDGIIARVENRAIAAALRKTGLPVVDVSAALPAPAFPQVVTDSRAVTKLAAEHLSACGFRNFGYCGDARFLWSARRAKYFASHLCAAGFGCSTFDSGPFDSRRRTVDSEVRAIARWLARLPKPVGVLACYDVRGQQVLEACLLAGLAVPGEVAVMGVHNDELLCDLCDPPLTSVMPDARRAGYLAAGLLTRMMRGERLQRRVHLVDPIGVAARQSTDVVAVTDAKVSAAVRFIREHAVENISVSDVLRAVPVSRTALERRFRRSLGQTPHELIQRVRLDWVKRLLATTDLPVGEIASRLAFDYTEYLSVSFRRATGMSPKEYRTKHRTFGDVAWAR